MRKPYDEKSIIAHLSRYTSVGFHTENLQGPKGPYSLKFIDVPRNGVGIHSWGKIDFLVNHCGYRLNRK